jgi:hypothetical protein
MTRHLDKDEYSDKEECAAELFDRIMTALGMFAIPFFFLYPLIDYYQHKTGRGSYDILKKQLEDDYKKKSAVIDKLKHR